MTLRDRARAYGIQPCYDLGGDKECVAPDETLRALLSAFGADRLPPLETEPKLQAPEGARCHVPGDGRHWGIALQLYQLRSDRNWGIGDFADLEVLAEHAAKAGAAFLGLNPLHAMFLSDPSRCSPFSPSNRRFLNPLYLAVDQVAGFEAGLVDPDVLRDLRSAELVDYPAVAATKLAVLRMIWAQRADLPDDFVADGGADLRRHALFEVASAAMVKAGHGAGWSDWPEPWQDVEGEAIRALAEDRADEIAFHMWLEYLCQSQLQALRERCRDLGMAIGLYLDFAVGEAADGSGSWGSDIVLPDVRIGAPPDYFNEQGQDWALAPLSPVAMAATQAAPFRELIGRATRQAGALRIDHAMGLWQLFLMPRGANPAQGTYARYPIQDMLTALADASRQNATTIIGEDLGNVPPGFRSVMEACRILSYRIFFFERDEDGFIPPKDYPREALACLSTHDLPTFRGWWRGDDVDLRQRFGFIGEAAATEQRESRATERRQLLGDLVQAGHIGAADAAAIGPDDAPPALITAVHRHLAGAPSRLFAVRLEDLAAELHPVNVPSTVDEYPNWRRKLSVTLDDLVASAMFHDLLEGVKAQRTAAH